jgi:hypothetical protein
MANRKRFSLRHSHAYGPDFANSLFISQRLSASTFLTELQSAQTGTGAVAYRVMLANKGDASLAIGLGPELESSKWIVGQFDAANATDGGTYADDADKAAVPLEKTGDNFDGHIVAATEPFSAIRYVIGTAGVKGAAAYNRNWYYWNGSQWAEMTLANYRIKETSISTVELAVGTHEVVFQPPAEWATATSSDITSLNSGSWYCIKMAPTVAPATTAAIATSLKVLHPLRLSVQLADADGEFEYVGGDRGIPLTGDGEALWAVQTGTADATLANMKYVTVIGENAGEAGTLGSE